MPSVSSSHRQPVRRRVQRSESLSSREGNVKTRKTGSMKELTVEIPTTMPSFLDRKKEQDRYAPTENSLSPEEDEETHEEEEGAAEQWLTSPRIASRRKERRELFGASAAALRRSTYENYESPVHRCLDARSSVSSPGTVGLRERMQRDFLKEEFHRRMRRSGVLLEVETTHGEENTKDNREPDHLTAKDKRQMQRSTSDARVERPTPMRRYSSAAEVRDRSRDESLPRLNTKPPTSPTSQSRKKKSSSTNQVTGEDAVLLRLSRQVRLGRRCGEPHLVLQQRRTNRITLHVYDLISKETIVVLPFGYEVPIGKLFNVLNSGLHSLGTGAYHVGVEVNGIEYAYGANNVEGSSGVFTCMPKCSPGYQYRSSINLGERVLKRRCWVNVPNIGKDSNVVKQFATGSSYREVETFVDGRAVIKEMASEYMGKQYDLLRKNCCTFAMDVCRRLGVQEEEVPSWFRNLADAGALTKDVALSTIEPLQIMLSSCDNGTAENILECEGDSGFEVIAKGKKGAQTKTEMEIVGVVEATDTNFQDGSTSPLGVRRTLSWTY